MNDQNNKKNTSAENKKKSDSENKKSTQPQNCGGKGNR